MHHVGLEIGMTLFILSSNNERIPFDQHKNTPLVLKSIQRLKMQEKNVHSTVKRTTADAMKQKQFGPLDIVITKRKMHLNAMPSKKRKGSQSKLYDEMSFPENLDDSFHQGLLGNVENGFENTMTTDHELPKPLAFEKRIKPEITATCGSFGAKAVQKCRIPETPVISYNISETNQLGKSLIPGKLHCPLTADHKGDQLACSTIPETPLLVNASPIAAEYFERQSTHFYAPETPVVLLKKKEEDWTRKCARKWSKRHVQVVPETPALKLKLTDELPLYD